MPVKKRHNEPRERIPYEDDEVDPIEMPENESNGTRAAYAANVIAQEIYSSVDAEGRKEQIIDEIIGYNRDKNYAVSKGKEFFFSKGRKHRRRTTDGMNGTNTNRTTLDNWLFY